MKYSIHDEEKVLEILQQYGFKPFRYKQIENAIYKNFIKDFNEINTVSKDTREILNKHFFFQELELVDRQNSSNNQTTKLLWKTRDGHFVESVIMRHLSGRNTLCVSSQVGCAMKCSFCATGKLGLTRNLDFYEIVEQILYVSDILSQNGEGGLRNIVYMGMGEPFNNYAEVKKSIEIALDQKKINLANRRVTISTCGIVPMIKEFAKDFPQTSLAISLHAPNDKIRNELMPVNKAYPLEKLIGALDEYIASTNKKIFYEYIMIRDLNDLPEHAEQLGQLLKHQKIAHVNFIPYNPGEAASGLTYEATNKARIIKFQKILEKYGIPSTIRATLGDDIDAACGQLAAKAKNKNKL
ncbi:MAG: 23S rRNA (adenine(2503)-C(2))-methyltransferase RlmN [Candidatus Gracilibacteria bacterium]|nr:23S rRNA (adenine(2503)-C(2))-methyltransferase RlmN [Candidatus Gracilibacteria bacterium]